MLFEISSKARKEELVEMKKELEKLKKSKQVQNSERLKNLSTAMEKVRAVHFILCLLK
jgi:hypothetical protein